MVVCDESKRTIIDILPDALLTSNWREAYSKIGFSNKIGYMPDGENSKEWFKANGYK